MIAGLTKSRPIHVHNPSALLAHIVELRKDGIILFGHETGIYSRCKAKKAESLILKGHFGLFI